MWHSGTHWQMQAVGTKIGQGGESKGVRATLPLVLYVHRILGQAPFHEMSHLSFCCLANGHFSPVLFEHL